MHARVITIEAAPERFDDSIAVVKSRVLRPPPGLPGFKGAYCLGDRSKGLTRVVIFFDSERNLHASREPSEQIGSEATSSVGARVEGVEEYEVVAATGQKVSGTAQFCRSLTWQENPNRIEQAIARIKDMIIPGVRRNAGFQGGFWLVDRQTGRCVGFTLWDTAENLQTSGKVGRQMRKEPARSGELAILGLQE